MIRAVVDTNLLISALLGGQSATLIDFWRDGRFTLIMSEEALTELLGVLHRPKFSRWITTDEVIEFGALVVERAVFVHPTTQLVLCRDPKDNFLLNLALAGKVDYLITGDGDFLEDKALVETMRNEYGVIVSNFAIFREKLRQT